MGVMVCFFEECGITKVELSDFMYLRKKKIDYFWKYGIILLVVSPTAKWTAKSVSNSNGVTTQMAMWKRIAIFYEEIYADRFQIIQGGYEIYP